MRRRDVLGVLLVVFTASASWAQTPLGTSFTYQGRLEHAGGPVNGLHDLRFRLYDVPTGGAPLGTTQCFDNVNVTDGLVTQSLDFGAQFTGQQHYLEIDVRADTGRDCTNASGFVVLTPRQPLTIAPHAAFAMNADRLDGLESTAFLQSVPTPLNLFGASPAAIVRGENTLTSGANYGMWGESRSTERRGVFGVAAADTGISYGVYGRTASTSGRGVYGEASAAAGFTYGGRFESASTNGRGVYGVANAATGETYGGRFATVSTGGRGVYGAASAATGTTYGGYFESASATGCGVFGRGEAYGVYGQTSSPGGSGVYALASTTSGGIGVHAECTSPSGNAIFAFASADTGYSRGVYGVSSGSTGTGVYGWASAGNSRTYGVVGQVYASSTGYGVYAYGDLGASGVKSFRIDHPDDPANKYLLHYAAESPEVINFYSETVTLDERGEASVELPHYFAKINARPRYQLTAIGAPMPMLHVAAEIDEAALREGAKAEPGEPAPICSFRIAGGVPGAKVSWEVKAVRNDLWLRAHGAPVEMDKQAPERGKYQHPELYGQPREKGVNYDPEAERRQRPSP